MNELKKLKLKYDLTYPKIAEFLNVTEEHTRKLGSSKKPLTQKVLKKIRQIEFYFDNPECQEHLRKIFFNI